MNFCMQGIMLDSGLPESAGHHGGHVYSYATEVHLGYTSASGCAGTGAEGSQRAPLPPP